MLKSKGSCRVISERMVSMSMSCVACVYDRVAFEYRCHGDNDY